MKPIVGIIMGSDSDLQIMQDAAKMLQEFDVAHEITIVSAHRTPNRLVEYSEEASSRGIKIIIAGAGGSAHLPGMVAAHTALPVIGVPIKTASMDGMDSLLSIVQMPPGVPVATVAINGAKNAALLAVEILGISQGSLHDKIVHFKKKMKEEVLAKADRLQQTGFERYLQGKGPL